jgi:hypothetical protein
MPFTIIKPEGAHQLKMDEKPISLLPLYTPTY